MSHFLETAQMENIEAILGLEMPQQSLEIEDVFRFIAMLEFSL